MEKDKLAPIYELMPTGWKEAAKETGAMVRSRKISTPEELLRLNFLYQTSGDSYGLTAALTQDLQQIYSRYIIVVTSLSSDISARKIQELYRMRWQIELVFKRLKSIFGGDFYAKRQDAIDAWFYGKLLLAIVCETLVKHGRFPPYTEKDDLYP